MTPRWLRPAQTRQLCPGFVDTHRQARSISYRIGGARFPGLKDLDTFVFVDTPVDADQVRELATGAFLDAKRNAIFIGGTGTGKTHLAIAAASAVIRTRARGASSILSASSTNSSRRRPPAAAGARPTPSLPSPTASSPPNADSRISK